MKYTDASNEPLEVIEANECNHGGYISLTTARFRRLFNEIERLQSELAALRPSISVPDGTLSPPEGVTLPSDPNAGSYRE